MISPKNSKKEQSGTKTEHKQETNVKNYNAALNTQTKDQNCQTGFLKPYMLLRRFILKHKGIEKLKYKYEKIYSMYILAQKKADMVPFI